MAGGGGERLSGEQLAISGRWQRAVAAGAVRVVIRETLTRFLLLISLTGDVLLEIGPRRQACTICLSWSRAAVGMRAACGASISGAASISIAGLASAPAAGMDCGPCVSAGAITCAAIFCVGGTECAISLVKMA